MASVNFEIVDGIAVLWIENPPVNALSAHVRAGLVHGVAEANRDARVSGMVIASRAKTFIAGADIKEFDKAPQPPSLREVLDVFDASSKPIVAAIDGAALGGGLEVALSCDERIATPRARLGLPEIKLGLLPGAGGTQRLPRAITGAVALTMMADGEPRTGEQAKALGIADSLVNADDLIGSAVTRAAALAKTGKRRRLRDNMPNASDREAFENVASDLLKSRAGEPQIEAIIDCVRNAFDLDFDEGMKRERAHFVKLLADDRSKAMRYAFFAERQSVQLPKAAKVAAPAEVRRVAVIGGGTMGAGIAISFANVGTPVTLVEKDEDAVSRAMQRVEQTYAQSVRRGSLSEQAKADRVRRITGAVGIPAVADADLVIEAVFEDMDVKKQVFAHVSKSAKGGAVLATNTSYLDVDELAASTPAPDRVVGMHFFSPANVMKLVEVVRGAQTSDVALATAVEVSRKLGKVPVVVGVCNGFVGNRMLSRRSEQVERLLLEGATPAEVDRVLTDFGFKMGPCAMSDLAGLDISWRMRRANGKTALVADALVEAGRLGQKSAGGYYSYPDGARQGVNDPAVDALLERLSRDAGLTRRKIDEAEILARLLLPMINEGARILDEGIAVRSGDIDVIWLHGYGFPRWHGGPMFYADAIGLGEVARRLDGYAKKSGDKTLEPAPLLRKLAREKNTFGSRASAA